MNILNENDEKPRFTKTTYTGVFHTNTSVMQAGSLHLSEPVRAVDPDDRNHVLIYEFIASNASWDPPTNYYSISPMTGLISHRADAYGRGYVTIDIRACESNMVSSCGYCKLVVIVHNPNTTERPEFGKYNYEINVNENVPINTLLLTLRVKHPSRFVYYHLDRNTSVQGKFTLDGVTGNLKTRLLLDYETSQMHTVPVFAANGQYTSTATVVINIIDYNEFEPHFDATIYIFSAQRWPGFSAGKVNFTDGDRYAIPEFRIEPHSGLFSVNTSGHVLVTSEEEAYVVNDYTFVLTLLDQDPPAKTTAVDVRVKFRSRLFTPAQQRQIALTFAIIVVVSGMSACVFGGHVHAKKQLRHQLALKNKDRLKQAFVPGKHKFRAHLTRMQIHERAILRRRLKAIRDRKRSCPSPPTPPSHRSPRPSHSLPSSHDRETVDYAASIRHIAAQLKTRTLSVLTPMTVDWEDFSKHILGKDSIYTADSEESETEEELEATVLPQRPHYSTSGSSSSVTID